MPNEFNAMSSSKKWSVLVRAATRALKAEGFAPERMPGRGRANIWRIKEGKGCKRVSIRTTRNRSIAYPPLEGGKRWKTLDDVDIVVVAAVDDYGNPNSVQVYRFDAGEVRKRFDKSYAARIQAGHRLQDGFGMWVNLDRSTSVGSGLAAKHDPIATYPLKELIVENGAETTEAEEDDGTATDTGASGREPHSIDEVMHQARKHIAKLSGVRMEAVKLCCRFET